MVGDTAVHPTVVLPTQDPAAIVHDQNIAPSQEPPRRQTKSAPTTPKRPRIKIAATNICNEDVPDVKASLERLKLKKMPDVSRRNLRTATSASAISTIRGQPFTVGNVSNGLIYLRPVVRPAQENPTSLRPSEERARNTWEDEHRHRGPGRRTAREKLPLISPPRTPPRQSSSRESSGLYTRMSPPVPTRPHHYRAHSLSTATGRSTPIVSDIDSYRIVIDRVETQRPKTAGPEPSFDGLHIKIPHCTLGSPQFTPHGTPFLQGPSSLNIASVNGELGSSTGSHFTYNQWLNPGDKSAKLSPSPIPLLTDRENSPFVSPPPSMASPIKHMPTTATITPEIFDMLSFPPFSDLPSVVKYDPRNQQILAATPPRIIAQITSATFLDYQLLSDFFLTYRLFMTPSDLVAYLISRLRWATSRSDDIGKVVRVRTFVAIRHWLLNYFGDDFVPSLSLRQKFVAALNGAAKTVLQGGSQSNIKIVGELKRCWRRTCALYWDKGDGNNATESGVEYDIFPGGPPGERNHSDIAGTGFPLLPPTMHASTRFYPSRSRQTAVNCGISQENAGNYNQLKTLGETRPVNKRFSIKRLEKKGPIRSADDEAMNATSQASTKVPKKPTPTAFMLPSFANHKPSLKGGVGPLSNNEVSPFMKNSRPSTHKRSGSFSDALRDDRQPLPLQNSLARSTHLLMAFPYGGASLVRGTLLPPTAAYVEVIAPSTPTPESGLCVSNNASMVSSSTSMSEQYEPANQGLKIGLGGPGMKKFIDSLKKALSGKGYQSIYGTTGMHSPVPVPNQGSASNESEIAQDSLSRYVAANFVRNSISAGSKANGRAYTGSMDGRTTRIDLLGAGVVDAFQRVMQEEGISGESSDDYHKTRRQSSTRSRPLLRRATVDTTTFGESALSEFDERSLMNENFPLSPQTRRRGFTVRGLPPGTAINKGKDIKNSPKEVPLANIHIEDFGFVGLEQSHTVSTTAKLNSKYSHNTLQAHKNVDNKLLRPSSVDSLISTTTGVLSSQRHSYNSSTGHVDDVASVLGTPENIIKSFPNRLLRRKPGGNLRAAATITDLGTPNRPKSTGSLSTFSQPMSVSSFNVSRASVLTFGHSRYNHKPRPHQLVPGVVSLGAVAKGGGVEFPPGDINPSTLDSPTTAKELFEKGVLQLAALTDSESDDGGIEVALMKLEGRYDRRTSKTFQTSSSEMAHQSVGISDMDVDNMPGHSEVISHKSLPLSRNEPLQDIDLNEVGRRGDQLTRLKRRNKKVVDQIPLETPPAFHSSASSFGFPLTEEGGVVPVISQLTFPGSSDKSSEDICSLPNISTSQPDLFTFLQQRNSQGTPVEAPPSYSGEVDGPDSMSELSSELSSEIPSRSQSMTKASSFKFRKSTVMADLGISSHPLRHPPSPPMTLEQALSMGPNASEGFYQNRLSTSDHEAFPWASTHNVSSPESTPKQRKKVQDSISLLQPPSIHLPFILAFDSELLAKQFTLIEKDALNEIDWKELVELRWKQTSTAVRDWVEFLKPKDVRGVELIIARFNLMWKWAMSEIVMTKDIDERARTIVKFIHIAAHARRLQNYATMYQITAALLTSHITRLRRTWKLIPAPDMATFKQLEALIQPVRNFHNLRVEMDKVTGETGCIPFVGLFTHDLIYNAQRPSHLVGAQDGELLVNFEKHRMTATIIKRLLRLTEASNKYDFKAVDGVCERCLWIASLSDDEIKGLSKNLES